MSAHLPKLRRGRIIFASIQDHNGHPKQRPCLIVTPTEAIEAETSLVVMAITTTFTDPPPPNHIPLPWHPKGHPVTRLLRRSAAVLDWLSVVTPNEVLGYGGDVPKKIMLEILSRLEALS